MGILGFFSRGKSSDKDRLEQLSRSFGGGEVLHKPNDQVWEWRGTIDGTLARIQTGDRCVNAWVKVQQAHGSFTLERNPAYIKQANDAPEQAWSDDDVVRVFVGPGVYLESMAFAMGDEVIAFEQLPASSGERIVSAMTTCEVGGVNTQSDEWLVRFDEKATNEHIVRFMKLIADVVAKPAAHSDASGSTSSDEASSADGWQERRMSCEYCRCTFLLGPAARCPNCGAPATR